METFKRTWEIKDREQLTRAQNKKAQQIRAHAKSKGDI